MKFEKVKEYVIGLLQKDLNKKLHYHCLWHTLNVMETVELYCNIGKFSDHDTIVVKTAALFHDTGFLYAYKGHEHESIKLARETLPKYGYIEENIDIICKAIMATEIPQEPLSFCSEILCDADLDYFGRDDFYMIAHSLKMEWADVLDRKLSLKEWYVQQLNFLKIHKYHTKIAGDLRNGKKSLHITQMEELLNINK